MKRITPDETNFSIWVSHLIAAGGMRPQPSPYEVTGAASAHIPLSTNLMARAHQHEDHEILTVLHGSGRVVLDDERQYQVSAGQIAIVPGGHSHLLAVDHQITLRGLYVHPHLCRELAECGGHEPVLDRLCDVHAPLAPAIVADAHHFRSLQELFEQCQAEYPHQDPWTLTCQRTIGQLVAITLVRLMQQAARTPQADSTTLRVLNVKAWMDHHFLDQIMLPDLARMAHLSPSQFSTIFRQLCGTSPKAYVIQRRLQRASELLAETEASVTAVASEVGFAHLAHFGRLFREHTGLTPRAYRKKHQNFPQKVLE